MNSPMTDWISVTRPWTSELKLVDGPVTLQCEAVAGVVFTLVVDGFVHLRVGERRFDLGSGEVALLVRGAAHQIDASDSTTLLVGVIGGSRCPITSLWAGEPDIIHLEAEAVARVSALRPLTSLIVSELRTPEAGFEPMRAGLLDALLVAILRGTTQARHGSSWLRGLDDALAGLALEAIHGSPDTNWTLDRLAKVTGVSRSLFARRFTECVGESPMAYVRRWRMSLAGRLLVSDPHRSLESIAQDVGYTSQYAFSRAFKRVLGQSPGRFRKQRTPPARMGS
ncbi:MAG: AraC family transcriptional regulator [Myxococcota bacterium]